MPDRTFELLSRGEQWVAGEGSRWDETRLALRLANQRSEPSLAEDEALATTLRARPPMAADGQDGRAWAEGGVVTAASALPGSVVRLDLGDMSITDLALGPDDVLSVAADGLLVLMDIRGRFIHRKLYTNAPVHRLAADPSGGGWLLDTAQGRLSRWRGLPSPPLGYIRRDPSVFVADPEIPEGLAITPALDRIAPQQTVVDLAVSPSGVLALLALTDGFAQVHLVDGQTLARRGALTLLGARWPYSLAWLDDGNIAVLVTHTPQGGAPAALGEALVYPAEPGPSLPLADLFPLRALDPGPFARGPSGPPRYRSEQTLRRLRRLSLPGFPTRGVAYSARPMRATSGRQTWGSLYLEGSAPEGCGIRLWLAASDSDTPPAEHARGPNGWQPHELGRVADPIPGAPRLTWLDADSELPFHPGVRAGVVGHAPRARGVRGLFGGLAQRAGLAVHTLTGSRLHVRLELFGDGRSTPELAALRVYGGEEDWRDALPPELYAERAVGAEADAAGAATGADFLGRLLSMARGLLTPIQDRVEHAGMLLDPESVPSASLDWLASWIGLVWEEDLAEAPRRRLLAAAPLLARTRGTRRGLEHTLDAITNGGRARGAFVVIEEHRVRRLLLTILGVDLADEQDPLLPGATDSGNSVVGDTLILGDAEQTELLAFYTDGTIRTRAEADAVAAWLESRAHRATVLIRPELEPMRPLLERVVRRAAPAHVRVDIRVASPALVVGLSTLVGVTTAVGREAPTPGLRLDQSALGVSGVLRRAPTLDPRDEGGA